MIKAWLDATPTDPAPLAAMCEVTDTTFEGCRTRWHLWGDGPVLVLIHGGYGSWTHWIRNIPALAEHHRLLVPDIPGLGDSASPPGDDPQWLGHALADGVRQLAPGAQDIALAGFSFGGAIAGLMLDGLMSRVGRLVLVGASALGLPLNADRRPLLSWRALETDEEVYAANRINLARHMFADPARIDDLAVRLQVENVRRARYRSAWVSRTTLLRDAIARHRVPLAGIWGARDVTCVGHISERRDLIRAFDPAAPFIEIEGAGHWVAYEASTAFNAALAQVLAAQRTK
jgi:2-hydroxy-6-oxonona-2,4-dienedioate hydrolase